MADLVFWGLVLAAVAIVWFWFNLFWAPFKRRQAELKRLRKSLKFDPEAKVYRWTSEAGTELESPNHPDQPGGVWFEAHGSENR